MADGRLPKWHGSKEFACHCRRHKRRDLIPGSRRPFGEGNGNPLQYSCPGNPMNRGVWKAIVHGVTELEMTENRTHSWKVGKNR